MGFYGFRAIITLYLIAGVGFPEEKAYDVYSYFITSLGIIPLLGGILGDVLKRNSHIAQIGAASSFLGLLCLLLPGSIALFSGITLVAMGTGIFSPNAMALFGRTMVSEEDRMDLWWTLLYLAVNFFVLLGPIFIGYAGEQIGWSYGFVFASTLPMVAFFLLRSASPRRKKDEASSASVAYQKEMGRNILVFIFLLFTSSIYWLFYQWGNNMARDSKAVKQGLESFFGDSMLPLARDTWPALVLMLALGAFAALWSRFRISSYYKLALALFVYAAASALFIPFFLDAAASTPRTIASNYLILFGTISVCEALVVPSVNSLITQNMPHGALGTAFGAYILFTFYRIEWVFSLVGQPHGEARLWGIYGIAGVFLALAIVLLFLGSKERRSKVA